MGFLPVLNQIRNFNYLLPSEKKKVLKVMGLNPIGGTIIY